MKEVKLKSIRYLMESKALQFINLLELSHSIGGNSISKFKRPVF